MAVDHRGSEDLQHCRQAWSGGQCRITTPTSSRSDANRKAAVVDELGWTPAADSTHIGVAVDGGAVTLSGEVATYPDKMLAGEASSGWLRNAPSTTRRA